MSIGVEKKRSKIRPLFAVPHCVPSASSSQPECQPECQTAQRMAWVSAGQKAESPLFAQKASFSQAALLSASFLVVVGFQIVAIAIPKR